MTGFALCWLKTVSSFWSQTVDFNICYNYQLIFASAKLRCWKIILFNHLKREYFFTCFAPMWFSDLNFDEKCYLFPEVLDYYICQYLRWYRRHISATLQEQSKLSIAIISISELSSINVQFPARVRPLTCRNTVNSLKI